MASVTLDRLLDPEYLGDLPARQIEEIRSMRAECQQVEVGLSYLRRLAQGRLDIVADELRRRTDGSPPTDMAGLVERLPSILAEHVTSPGPGRLPTYFDPGDLAEVSEQLDKIVDTAALSALPELSDDEVRTLMHRLTGLEHEVSAQRRALHESIDALQSELTRRYKTGEATVESLYQR
jgi:hypothetical protein